MNEEERGTTLVPDSKLRSNLATKKPLHKSSTLGAIPFGTSFHVKSGFSVARGTSASGTLEIGQAKVPFRIT